MKTKILQLLHRRGEFVSGQDICNELGVSRTAVWKIINQLKEAGYEIEAIRNKGYCLRYSPDILTEEGFYSIRKTKFAGCKVYCYNEIGSTNDQAKKLAEEEAVHGTLVIADVQTNGKGRRGRKWDSPFGDGIYFTLLLKPEIEPSRASMLTLVMALAVTKGLTQITSLKPLIKWPNDIVLDGKKVCGILTEMSLLMDEINHIVIGTGINIYNKDFPEEIDKTATSIRKELEKQKKDLRFSRLELLEIIMEKFEHYYELYIKSKDLSLMYQEYNELLINKDRTVTILDTKNTYEAVAIGINEIGELIVKKDNDYKKISSGEVSVRGVYGYV